MAKRRSDIKPSIELPDLNSQPNYHGQDLHDLLGDARSKIDMNWLEALGGGKPGSTTGFNGGTTTPNTTTPANPSALNFDSDWKDILTQLGYGDQFTQFLSQLGIGGKDPYDQSMHDLNQSIYQAILQHYVNEEQRSYDRALQKDQRLYDSPLNQLARLMGAGISRDAAIQMLSGSGSGSGAAVPYGSQGSQILGESASQAYANQMAGSTAIANTIFNGLGTLCGLVQMGFSVPQAIQQTQALRYANTLTGQSVQAYQSAGQAYQILNSIGAAAESYSSVSSVASAIESAAKGGNADAMQFVASGGLDQMKLNAPFASKVIGELYNADRSSADKSRSMDQYFLQQDLQNALLELEGQLGHRQFEMMGKKLLQADEELNLLYQQFRRGEVEIKIAGETLKAQKYENIFNKFQSQAFEDAMTTTYDGEPQGRDLLAESTWRGLYAHWRKLAVEQSPENIENYQMFLQNNFDAACYMATIKAASQKQLSDVWQSDGNESASVWNRFTNIFFGTKSDEIIQLGTGAAEVGAIMYGASPLSRQGSVRHVRGL